MIANALSESKGGSRKVGRSDYLRTWLKDSRNGTNLKLDAKGYIEVNDRYATSVSGKSESV